MKTGIFFSRCSGAMEGIVDIEELAKAYSQVAPTKVYDSFYNIDEFNDLLKTVKNDELDSIILVGESHYYYQQIRNGDFIFKCLREHGINNNMVGIVNLINMVGRPHKGAPPQMLITKARLLIDAALDKLRHSHVIDVVEISPRKAVAIVGINTSSFVVAQHLLDAGYKVFLINELAELQLPKAEALYIQPTIPYVMNHSRVNVIHNSQTSDFYGYPGDYTLMMKDAAGAEREIHVGAVVLCIDNKQALIKAAQTAFHIDINEQGVLLARDEVTARSLTLNRGILMVKPAAASKEEAAPWQKFEGADATASMVINLLNKTEIFHEIKVSEVDPTLCSGCGACVKTCMFHAVTIQGRPPVSSIDPRRCRGCGNCVTACPAEARNLAASPNIALYSAIDIYAGFSGSGPKVLFIGCDGCGYRCLDAAGQAEMSWPVSLLPLRVVCGGQLDTQLIMYALVKGFDGVLVGICGEGCCHNIIGNVDLERRANLFLEILDSRGIDPGKIKIISTCSRSGQDCVKGINEFYKRFERTGLETIVHK